MVLRPSSAENHFTGGGWSNARVNQELAVREGIDGHTCSRTIGFTIWTILCSAQGDIMAYG
jgi:hypothetical protein